ncbi:MAG: rRNA pseudouridine synthase [Lachnospiraceae bacterium]|nr:rRNA pseudouridine synthase [Lachnospiraceae bacterium]
MKPVRLDKFLADAKLGTRSEVRQLLKKGLITLNGEIVKKPDIKVDPASDRVLFDGKEIFSEKDVYFMLNKPAGVVSATEDRREKTVLDLFSSEDRRRDLFPVGRLDKDTVGLLLITNDGALSHRLLSPRRHVDKTYLVHLDRPIPADAEKRMEAGLDIGDEKPTLPAYLEVLSETTARITIQEGRFHQIKRMFHAVGCEVIYLKRLSMGSLALDPALEEGCYRRLTPEEINKITSDS